MSAPLSESCAVATGAPAHGGRHAVTVAAGFVSGIASVLSLSSQFPAISGHEVTLAITAGTLPTGVTLDQVGRRLVYDGTVGVSAVNVTITSTPNAPALTVSGSGSNLPIMAGICFARGSVTAAGLGASQSNLGIQIQRLWNDGSIKHAVVMGTANAGDRITFTNSPSSGTVLAHSDIVASAPTATITLSGIGSASLATLLGSAPLRTWMATSGMVECHYRTAVGSGVDVEFRVRRYIGGKVWVQALIEFSKVAAPYPATGEQQTLTGTVIIDGTTVQTYSATPLYVNTSHIHERWIGATQYTHFAHNDMVQVQRTKLVPNYGFCPTMQETDLAGIVTAGRDTYQINVRGAWRPYFGAGGSDPQIAVLPLWDAQHLCSSGDDRSMRAVKAQTKSIFNYPVCWRHNGRMQALSDVPNAFATENAFNMVAGALSWEAAHHGSAGYVDYLLTGDALASDAMTGQAAAIFQCTSYSQGSGTARTWKYAQNRSQAWRMRTYGQAAGILPSGMINQADIAANLKANITYWRSISIDDPAAAASVLGYPYSCSNYENATPKLLNMAQTSWQYDFWMASFGHISDLEPLSSSDMVDLLRLRDWMYKGIVGRLGDSSGYYFGYATQYPITISPNKVADGAVVGASQLYFTWAEVAANTMWQPGSAYNDYNTVPMVSEQPTDNTLHGFSAEGGVATDAPGGSWTMATSAIAYAVEHGAAGASASYARLTGATNWSAIANANYSPAPQWGMTPRAALATASKAVGVTVAAASSGRPSWRTAKGQYQWGIIPSSRKLSQLDPALDPLINANYPGSAEWQGSQGVAGVIGSWNGGCGDKARSIFWLVLTGGHGDYGGNEPYKIEFNHEITDWVMLRPPTGALPGNIQTQAAVSTNTVFSDGRPKAVHSGNKPVYVPGVGPMLAIHGSSVTYAANGEDPKPLLLDETTGEMTFLADNPGAGLAGGGEWGGSAYDSSRHCVWWMPSWNNPRMTRYNIAANTWTLVGNNVTASSNSMCYIPGDDVLLVICGSFANGIGVFDCATGTWTYPNLTGSFVGGLNIFNGNNYGCISPQWVDDLSAAAVWDNATSTTVINLLNKPANPRTGTWTITQLPVSGSNTVTPTARNATGTYGDFQYWPELGMFTLINATNQDIYFFALD